MFCLLSQMPVSSKSRKLSGYMIKERSHLPLNVIKENMKHIRARRKESILELEK